MHTVVNYIVMPTLSKKLNFQRGTITRFIVVGKQLCICEEAFSEVRKCGDLTCIVYLVVFLTFSFISRMPTNQSRLALQHRMLHYLTLNRALFSNKLH